MTTFTGGNDNTTTAHSQPLLSLTSCIITTLFCLQEIDANKAELDSIRQREIDRCAQAVEDEEKSQWMAGSYEDLIAAKKENVALQLEAEYRARLKDAYTQVCYQKNLDRYKTYKIVSKILTVKAMSKN